MRFIESHFWYNRSQRNGILTLIILVLVVQLIYIFLDFPEEEIQLPKEVIAQYQAHIDSIKENKISINKPKSYPFNPNYLSDYKGYRIGMSVKEIDRLMEFRKRGKFVNSAEEFQKVTQISDSLLNEISSSFRFPEWVSQSENKKILKSDKIAIVEDLNMVSESDLMKINGIGQKLSSRIVSYRKLIGGFTYDDQLYEVYYLKREIAEIILNKYKVIVKPDIKKININDATFKEVLKIPYIDYDLTKKLFNYRDRVKIILSIEELKEIDSFPMEKFERITLYLATE